MNPTEAISLCKKLQRRALVDARKIGATVVIGELERVAAFDENGRARWAYRPAARIVFTGGATGEHSLDVYASDEARVLAHWAGYAAANRWEAPAVGSLVRFHSGSSRSGLRCGRVVKVGPKRATIAFTYKHGGKSTTTRPIGELRFDPAKA